MKKIAIGSLAQESNSFSPIKTRLEDFQVLRGYSEITEKFNEASQVFCDAGFEIVTAVSAYALPGGSVVKEDFIRLAQELVGRIPQDVSGVWLMLHGAMYVEGIQSGEEYVMRLIREKLGEGIPVAVCMDMHANHTPAFIDRATIIRGYHTAPHEDWDYENCQRITAKALVRAVNGERMKTVMKTSAVRLFGENFMTDFDPAKQIVEQSEEFEKIPGVTAVTVFVGMAWVDCPYNTVSFVMTADEAFPHAQELLGRLADYVTEKRNEFVIPAPNMPLEEAVKYCEKLAKRTVYISDSGDNVTAGAAGDSAYCLRYLTEYGKSGYLVAGIFDRPFVERCFAENQARLHGTVGASKDAGSTRLEADFEILARFSSDVEAVKKVRLVLAKTGGNYLLVTDKRCAFTCEEEIAAFAGELTDYTGIFVKLGYLFPDLVKNAAGTVIALTPGNACLDQTRIVYKNSNK